MDIYIKLAKKVSLSGRRDILIKDVAEVVAEPEVAAKVKIMKLQKIGSDGERKKNYLVSITDIIKEIKKTYPKCTVNNVGEMDTLVQYAAGKSRDNALLKWLRVSFVALVLMAGSSTAIMSFHTDGQIPKIFERYYSMFFGQEKSNPGIINIPYSIGIAIGITVFYNHFMGRKITDDPTPIEVEVEQYDTEVTNAVVDMLSRRQSEIEIGGGVGDV